MKNTALLVVDVQNALVSEKPFDVEEVISSIKKLIAACRENNVEVIYIQHNDEIGGELEPQSTGWKLYKEISPDKNEKVISKNYNSAFKGTNLKEYLESKGINTLIITGMQTEYCIDTTIKAAFEYGFNLIIPEKANTTFDNGSIPQEELYKFYNYRVWDGRFGKVVSVQDIIAELKR
ncbi:MAG: cysteine hydrolase [Bacillota bacterium]|nr:cysteine hydrolase [Bacillota bacterium]